jgi:hypothetical protein
MNEIKPAIPKLAHNLTLDKLSLKLLTGQMYQAQLQQLSSGSFSLQVSSKQGSLQIPLPSNINSLLKHHIAVNTPRLAMPVQVEFLSQEQGQLSLAIKSTITNINLPISQRQSQQVMLALSPSVLAHSAASKIQPVASVLVNASAQPTAAVINANLCISANKLVLQIANLPAIAISSTSSRMLSAALQSHALTFTNNEQLVQLTLRPNNSQLQLITADATLHSKINLTMAEHHAIQQQLRSLINQQSPTITLNNHQLSIGKLQLLSLSPQSSTAGLKNNFQVQLQQRGSQWLLHLSSKPFSEIVNVATDKLNHNIQLSNAAQVHTGLLKSVMPASSQESQQQSVQQAWRQLLPLLATNIDPLAEQTTLVPAASKILALVRQGQPDGNKVLSVSQLMQQLNALLQFQPLQATPNLQTGAGTLALAIQLLLGALQQKTTAPANQSPSAQRLATLIGQLDSSQTSGLLRQLASHSSALQQSQLNMLDASSNQQLVLQLPLQQGQQSVLSQMSIEQRESGNQEQSQKQKQWRLTMKFDLQQLGKLLVVATLQQQELQLQFYAEQAAAQRVTEQFLPLLKQRCQSQGIEVNKAECVLGVIPDSLMPRTNSLVTIRV